MKGGIALPTAARMVALATGCFTHLVQWYRWERGNGKSWYDTLKTIAVMCSPEKSGIHQGKATFFVTHIKQSVAQSDVFLVVYYTWF